MNHFTDFSIVAILGLKNENPAHVPHCVSQSALLAGPPRNQVRRSRTTFSDDNVNKMQRVFEVNQYPNIGLREQLARETGIPESRIQVWFQNRRMRIRRKGNTITNTSSTTTTSNRKQKPPALTLDEPHDSSMKRLSPPENNLLFQLPELISPLPATPVLLTHAYPMFHFAVRPISPLPKTFQRESFRVPDVPQCRSWLNFCSSSGYMTRHADYLDSSSPESNYVDGDNDEDTLVIDFDV